MRQDLREAIGRLTSAQRAGWVLKKRKDTWFSETGETEVRIDAAIAKSRSEGEVCSREAGMMVSIFLVNYEVLSFAESVRAGGFLISSDYKHVRKTLRGKLRSPVIPLSWLWSHVKLITVASLHFLKPHLYLGSVRITEIQKGVTDMIT